MEDMTYIQAVELIDIAANENRVWNNNGGYVYIRVSNDSNVLMIINHSIFPRIPEIMLLDGTEYFKNHAGAQFEYSRILRESDTTCVEFYKKLCTDVLPLETV